MVLVYFRLSFPPGLSHDWTWFGTLDDAGAYDGLVEIKFWQDTLGLGWGICDAGTWAAYSADVAATSTDTQQTVTQVEEADVAAAVDSSLWSL